MSFLYELYRRRGAVTLIFLFLFFFFFFFFLRIFYPFPPLQLPFFLFPSFFPPFVIAMTPSMRTCLTKSLQQPFTIAPASAPLTESRRRNQVPCLPLRALRSLEGKSGSTSRTSQGLQGLFSGEQRTTVGFFTSKLPLGSAVSCPVSPAAPALGALPFRADHAR